MSQSCPTVVSNVPKLSPNSLQVVSKLSQSCPTNPQWNGVCKDFKNQLCRDDEDRNSRDLGAREAAEERREQRRSGLSGAGNVDNHLCDNDIITITIIIIITSLFARAEVEQALQGRARG